MKIKKGTIPDIKACFSWLLCEIGIVRAIIMKLFLGIDGGGTKTDYLLCDETGHIISYARAKGLNPMDFGLAECQQRMKEGINTLSGVDASQVAGIYAGISGGSGKTEREFFQSYLQGMFPTAQVICGSDAVAALNSGLCSAKEDGGVLIAGTGSVGYARKAGKLFRIGGYGYLIDKGGSGFDFGHDALYSVFSHLDGRGPKTALTELLYHQIGDPLTHINQIYKGGKAYIASFAPLVFEAYRAGDAVATRIIEQNAQEIATLLQAIANHLDNDNRPIVLTGGIFQERKILSPLLTAMLNNRFHLIYPEYPPVYGAILEAAETVGYKPIPSFREQFILGWTSLKRL